MLWILGLQGPLPKKMQWRSVEFEAAVAASQELLAPAEVDAEVGILSRLTVLPSLIGARNNPDGKTLQDVVPPDLYARWLVLKAKYLGDADSVEKWRPLFAAFELYRKAISKAGLERSDELLPVVTKLARKRGLKVTTPEITVKVEKPRAAIKEFKREPLDDLPCFAKTIARLESDLDLMRARANAWATGNIEALRAMTPVGQASACIAAVMNAQVLQERGFADLPARLATAWIAAAERAVEQNASTVAVLPMREILEPAGIGRPATRARIRGRGSRLIIDREPAALPARAQPKNSCRVYWLSTYSLTDVISPSLTVNRKWIQKSKCRPSLSLPRTRISAATRSASAVMPAMSKVKKPSYGSWSMAAASCAFV